MKIRTIVFQTVSHSLLALPQRGRASRLALKNNAGSSLDFVDLYGRGRVCPHSRFTHSAERVS